MLPYAKGVDQRDLLAQIGAGGPASLRLPAVVDSRINAISGFLYRLLGSFDLSYLSEVSLVLLKEALSNASKANAKRIFFRDQGIDIQGPEYERVKDEYTRQVLQHWEDRQAEFAANKEHYIELRFAKDGKRLRFDVINNVELTRQEEERVQARRASFQKHPDINAAFSSIRDDSEGAGLGIFLCLSLLENAGIPAEANFNISSEAGVTTTTIGIPLQVTQPELKSDFYARVLHEIEELPSFPDHIGRILSLCESETASVAAIADAIGTDPGLTAQILKMVNSAGYMSRNRNPGLRDAVKIIGLNVIRNLLMVSGARDAIGRRYRIKQLEQIWEDSNRVSFFARRLASGRGAGVMELVTVAGLLFELGKIVLMSLQPEVVEKLEKIFEKRVRTPGVIEETVLGIAHPEIGARMADEWNFPDALVAAIRYQHRPLSAPPEYSQEVQIIHVAAILQRASVGEADYYCGEPELLESLGMATEEQFRERLSALESAYAAGKNGS